MAWAYPEDSELVGAFNYHTLKMQATGNIDRFWQEVERKQNMNNGDTKLQNANIVGYENAAFPFLALLTGLLAAILLLGTEIAVFCKKKYAYDENAIQSNENSAHSQSREAILAIKEVCDMLLENNSNLKDSYNPKCKTRGAREIIEEINRLPQETNSK